MHGNPRRSSVTWLGYFATTGVEAIDYLLADSWTLPETEEMNFTETIWRLPETRLCFTVPDFEAGVAPLPALRNGYVTFGCFNHLSKMNDDVVALWGQLLRALPGSRLFLLGSVITPPHRHNALVQDEILTRRHAGLPMSAKYSLRAVSTSETRSSMGTSL